MSNLSTDPKLSTKSLTTKSNSDKLENKQNVFKSNNDDESILNKDTSQQTTTGAINNAMITTLAETPC